MWNENDWHGGHGCAGMPWWGPGRDRVAVDPVELDRVLEREERELGRMKVAAIVGVAVVAVALVAWALTGGPARVPMVHRHAWLAFAMVWWGIACSLWLGCAPAGVMGMWHVLSGPVREWAGTFLAVVMGVFALPASVFVGPFVLGWQFFCVHRLRRMRGAATGSSDVYVW